MWTAFPSSDYYAPSDSSLGFGVSLGSRLPTSTPLCIPKEVSRVHIAGLNRNNLGGVFSGCPIRSLRVPSSNTGYAGLPVLPWCPRFSWSTLVPTFPRPWGFRTRLADISSKVCRGTTYTVGLCTLQVIHHVIPQPSTTSWRLASSSWRLSGACCSPCRVVCKA